jgi:hypothetical protein
MDNLAIDRVTISRPAWLEPNYVRNTQPFETMQSSLRRH